MWLRDWTRRPRAAARLLCLPSAGGSASAFRGWAAGLPAWLGVVAVELPGHGARMGQRPVSSAGELFSGGLVDEVRALSDRPLILFGHSLGGRIALGLAAALARAGAAAPLLLVVAACECPAPAAPIRDRGRDPDLDDAAVRAFLRRQGGTDPQVLADPELMGLLLPAVRADLRLAFDLDREPAEPLPAPVHVYLGDDDRSVPRESALGWAEYSGPGFALRSFPGGHFFVRESEDEVLLALDADIRRATGHTAWTDDHRSGRRG